MKALLAAAIFARALTAADAPPAVSALLDQAKATAAADNRAIFLVFGASW